MRTRTGPPGWDSQPSEVRTFEQVAEEYLATLVDTRRRTVAEYRRDLRAHVLSARLALPDGRRVGPWAKVPVDRFDTDVVQAWINHMRTKTYGTKSPQRYSAKTVLNIHGAVIFPVFEFAVDRGYVGASPCRRVRLPQKRGRSVKAHHVLDVTEMPDWIDCAYQVDTDTGDITALILGTGLRWGELTGLRVCDINVRAATLTITQVVREDENRKLYLDTEEGKSENAFRTIALPVTAVRILHARMKGRARTDLLFPPPGTFGGKLWRNSNFHSHRWKKVKPTCTWTSSTPLARSGSPATCRSPTWISRVRHAPPPPPHTTTRRSATHSTSKINSRAKSGYKTSPAKSFTPPPPDSPPIASSRHRELTGVRRGAERHTLVAESPSIRNLLRGLGAHHAEPQA